MAIADIRATRDQPRPYSGYFQRDVPPADAELAHAGPGTPAGEYMRRFWQPVCLSEQLNDLPREIRVLGEDLVAFRDRSGCSAPGSLDTSLSHAAGLIEIAACHA